MADDHNSLPERYGGTVAPVGNSKGIRLDAKFFKAHPEFSDKVAVTVVGRRPGPAVGEVGQRPAPQRTRVIRSWLGS
jgi:hypothetical protein